MPCACRNRGHPSSSSATSLKTYAAMLRGCPRELPVNAMRMPQPRATVKQQRDLLKSVRNVEGMPLGVAGQCNAHAATEGHPSSSSANFLKACAKLRGCPRELPVNAMHMPQPRAPVEQQHNLLKSVRNVEGVPAGVAAQCHAHAATEITRPAAAQPGTGCSPR